MTDYVSIANVKETHKGNFKGSCIRQSDLKAGSGKSGDWTRKIFTLQDASGEIEITAWNEEIQFFQVGQFYEVESAWWKEYEGKCSCNIGQYCKIRLVKNPPTEPTAPTIQEAEEIANESSDTEIEPEPQGKGSVNGEKIPDLKNIDILEFVDSQCLLLLQFREAVKARMNLHTAEVNSLNGGEVGGYTLEIYRQYRIHKQRLEHD